MTQSAVANVNADLSVSLPWGNGRPIVRIIRMSMRWSRTWLKTAAEDDARPMPSVPNSNATGSGQPGTARNMPTIAVNTINMTTRGLVSS